MLNSHHVGPRGDRGLQAQLLSTWWKRHCARSGNFDVAVTAHRFQELFYLFQVAGGFDHKAFGGGVDYSRSEDFGFFQYRGAALLTGANAQQHELSGYRGRFSKIGGLEDVPATQDDEVRKLGSV